MYCDAGVSVNCDTGNCTLHNAHFAIGRELKTGLVSVCQG